MLINHHLLKLFVDIAALIRCPGLQVKLMYMHTI